MDLVPSQVRDINSDPDCVRTMATDIDFDSSLGLNVTMAPGGSIVHADWHAPHGTWPLEIDTVPGGLPDCRSLNSP